MQSRPYQVQAVKNVLRHIWQKPLLVAPTGSGKTHMAVSIVGSFRGKTLWIAHRRELIHQAASRLKKHGLNVGIIMAGTDHNHYAEGLFSDPASPASPAVPILGKVNVASIQTLQRREIPEGTELIVVDEAHHCIAESYGDLFAYADERRIPVLGLTATPFRMDGKPLGDIFESLIVAAYPDELIAQGYLVKPRVYAGSDPDLQGVKITAGDYNKQQLDNAINKPKLIADIGDTWQSHRGRALVAGCSDRAGVWRTICFASSVGHSKQIVAEFTGRGIRAEHIDGETPSADRDGILSRLASGATEIVSNYGVLTEGWDLPALECAIIGRPTESLNLHLQMIGRVMRPNDGKAGAVVLDHAGNHHRHGTVQRRYEYSLTGTVKPAAESEPLGMRHCKSCLILISNTATECPNCGAEVLPDDRGEIQQVDGDLVNFDDSSFEYRAAYWSRLVAEFQDFNNAAISDGRDSRSEGWLRHRFHERFGEWPVIVDVGYGLELVNPAKATKTQKRAVYEELVAVARERGFKDGWASHKYRGIFGVWPSGFVSEVRGDGQALVNELAGKWGGK